MWELFNLPHFSVYFAFSQNKTSSKSWLKVLNFYKLRLVSYSIVPEKIKIHIIYLTMLLFINLFLQERPRVGKNDFINELG